MKQRNAFLLLGHLASVHALSSASALNLYWDSEGSGFNWNSAGNGGNWSYYNSGYFYASAPPTSADFVILGWLESPTTINVTPGATAHSLWVADGEATLNLQSNTLTLVDDPTAGSGYDGVLQANNGTFLLSQLLVFEWGKRLSGLHKRQPELVGIQRDRL